MRARTSPTAISISCCWPRSIVRCSGSVRSRGGSSPGWPNWPKSSATHRALEVVEDRLSYAEILLDLVQHVRRAPAGLEMARACTVRTPGRAHSRCHHGPCEARLAASGIGTAAVILPVVDRLGRLDRLPHAPVSAPPSTRASRRRRPLRKPQSVAFYSLGRASIFAISREGDDLFGQLSGQRRLRLAAASDGTYSYPAAAGQITLAVGDERQPAELMLSQNGRDMRAIRVAELPGEAVEADAGADRFICRLVRTGP